MLGEQVSPEELVQAGVVEEIFEDSAIPGVNSHCINSVFAFKLPSSFQQDRLIRRSAIGDRQHSEGAWLDVDDPTLHLFMRRKVKVCLRALQHVPIVQHQHTNHDTNTRCKK